MKCDCDHPRNDDGLHMSGCSLIAFNKAVREAVDDAMSEIRARLDQIAQAIDELLRGAR